MTHSNIYDIINIQGGKDMSVDINKVAEHLGVESEPVVKEEVKSTPAGKIVQASVSCRISPRGTYSAAELSKTVDIFTTDRDVVDGIIEQLKEEVVKDTINVADRMVEEANKIGML